MRVEIYWNLHKKVFSLKNKGKVVDYKDKVYLTNCSFKTWEGARQKVIQDKRKSVHSFVCGEITNQFNIDNMRRFSYNPYKNKGFIDNISGSLLNRANHVFLDGTSKKPVCWYN